MSFDNLCITIENDTYLDKAEELSKKLGARIEREDTDKQLSLYISENGISLKGDGMELIADFKRMIPRLKPNNLNGEFVVKAARIKSLDKNITILDATAGFGEDSFLLAAYGFNVVLYEYDPIIAILLSDAIERAKYIDEFAPIVERMNFFEGNSIEAMKNLSFIPDVILLDPMFPERQKSASVKKKFQLLQKLEHPCDNEIELFNAAMLVHPKRIIIKRPIKGPYLANVKPSYSLNGKAIRYDCIGL